MKCEVSAAVLLIGDEVLSGRTKDANLSQIAEFLQPLGVSVREARVVPDEQAVIVDAVRALSAAYDYVFTTGGIGPTHDDITADAMAAAFGRAIDVRADALEVLEEWYARSQTDITPARLRMARIPDGASLIANPVTGAPGFQIENVFVLAGVPKIARGMLEDVAARIEGGAVTHSVTVRLEGIREGDIAESLGAMAADNPSVSLGSYPWFEEAPGGGLRRGVALVARGTDAAQLDRLRSQLEALG
ncbi:competence/damage-inducible protein A [Alkalicaulis satelles]|uniref:Competence/damage-inducible protein A n=1 Tax=Alkalicaulis satelles TaxID=2609175 RepID=A0A5M6ZBH5_9PROT|nr:molybdopterin-binding protein [Alkalicaulis satelles]KAA5801685.1 competence/damage-inducible protein A [Alkalicaulis satelles]